MKKIVICLVSLVFLVGIANAQTKSVEGKVVEVDTGALGKFEFVTIIVGGKKYSFYTYSTYGERAYNPKVIGNVGIGKTLRVYYSQIERGRDGYDLTAIKVVEVKQSKSKKL